MLVHVKDWGSYETMGSTLDDAVGEAFDKVAKAMGLGYPGGPLISALAEKGNPKAARFPRALMHSGDLQFSLSGLKTSVMTYLQKEQQAGREINRLRWRQAFRLQLSMFKWPRPVQRFARRRKGVLPGRWRCRQP